jgi:hypothetical protein
MASRLVFDDPKDALAHEHVLVAIKTQTEGLARGRREDGKVPDLDGGEALASSNGHSRPTRHNAERRHRLRRRRGAAERAARVVRSRPGMRARVQAHRDRLRGRAGAAARPAHGGRRVALQPGLRTAGRTLRHLEAASGRRGPLRWRRLVVPARLRAQPRPMRARTGSGAKGRCGQGGGNRPRGSCERMWQSATNQTQAAPASCEEIGA